MKNNFKNQRGFSLIEMIVYIGIFSILMSTIVMFLNTISTSRINNQILLEVNNQGSSLIKTINYNIRNGVSVVGPSANNSAESLSIETSDVNTNPIVFYLTDGVFYIKEGASDGIALTNNRIKVSGLSFTNLSRTLTPGIVQVRFKIDGFSHNDIIYSSNFYGSSSIRK